MELLVDFNDVDSFGFDHAALVKCYVLITADYGLVLGDLSVVFCSDEFILSVNQEFLNHDYYTDIITFDYCEAGMVSGDLIVSIDTVKSNSTLFATEFHVELFRVLIHGVLHLCGLGDKTVEDAELMRLREEHYLSLCDNPFVSRET